MSPTADGRRPVDLRFELHPGPTAPRAARRRVVAAVSELDGVDLEVLALLTSELVTNVVLHAATDASVRVAVRGPSVRVEVSDDAPAMPEPRLAAGDAVTGRGLMIVDALADRWGVSRLDGMAKTVWFELDRDQEGTT